MSMNEDASVGCFMTYESETRDVAAELSEFSQRHAASRLSEAVLDSSASVAATIGDMDKSCRRVMDVIFDENKTLREELLKLAESSAFSVQDAILAPSSGTADQIHVSPSDLQPLPAVCSACQSAMEQLTSLVQVLATDNQRLAAELEEMRTLYVPAERAKLLERRVVELECEVITNRADLEAALIRAEDAASRFISGAAETDDDLLSQGAPSRPVEFVRKTQRLTTGTTQRKEDGAFLRHEPLWADAIRELEEQAVMMANQRKEQASMEEVQRDMDDLRARLDMLTAQSEVDQGVHNALAADYQNLRQQNETLTGEFISLLDTTQKLASHCRLLADVEARESSGRERSGSGNNSPADMYRSLEIPLTAQNANVKQLLVSLRRFDKVAEDTASGQNEEVLGSKIGDVRFSNNTSLYGKTLLTTSMQGGASPAPYVPTKTKQFSRDQLAALSTTHPISSIEDVVKRNQKLISENYSLKTELSTVRDQLRTLETMTTASNSNNNSKPPRSSSTGTEQLSTKRAREEYTSRCVTTEIGCMTDAFCELSWLTDQQQQSRLDSSKSLSTQLPKTAFPSSTLLSSCQGDDSSRWEVLAMIADAHAQFSELTIKSLGCLTGMDHEHALGNLILATVQLLARTQQAERQRDLAQCAQDEALEELRVRDAMHPDVLRALQSTVEAAVTVVQSLWSERHQHGHLGGSASTSTSKQSNAELSLFQNMLNLLEEATGREQLLQQLVLQTPGRLQLANTTAYSRDSEEKLREAEGVIEELKLQLQRERDRSKHHMDMLHKEKMNFMNTLERLWKAEQEAVEAKEAVAAMQDRSDRMYTADQYNEVQASLAAARKQTLDTEAQLLAERESHAHATMKQNELLHHSTAENCRLQNTVSELEYRLSDARTSASLHAARTRDLHSEVTSLQYNAETLNRSLLAAHERLAFEESLVSELKLALLSQSCTEQLLFSLFPGESSLKALVSRGRELSEENTHLKNTLANAEVSIAAAHEELNALRQALKMEQDDKQHVLVELRSIQMSYLSEDATAASENERLRTELEGCRHRIAELTVLSEQSRIREETLQERVSTLAADPISLNVRKYGVERLRTIEDQMQQLHDRFTSLEAQHSQSEAEKRRYMDEVARLTDALHEVDTKNNEQSTTICSLRAGLEEKEALLLDRIRNVSSLEQSMATLQHELAQTARTLAESRTEVATLTAKLTASIEREAIVKKDDEKLMEDNIALISQLNELSDVVSRLEADLRATKSAYETQTRALAAQAAATAAATRHGGFGGGGGGGGVSSSRKAATSFQLAASMRAQNRL